MLAISQVIRELTFLKLFLQSASCLQSRRLQATSS